MYVTLCWSRQWLALIPIRYCHRWNHWASTACIFEGHSPSVSHHVIVCWSPVDVPHLHPVLELVRSILDGTGTGTRTILISQNWTLTRFKSPVVRTFNTLSLSSWGSRAYALPPFSHGAWFYPTNRRMGWNTGKSFKRKTKLFFHFNSAVNND